MVALPLAIISLIALIDGLNVSSLSFYVYSLLRSLLVGFKL